VLLVETERARQPADCRPRLLLDDGAVVYGGTAAELANDEERVRAMAGASAGEWAMGA